MFAIAVAELIQFILQSFIFGHFSGVEEIVDVEDLSVELRSAVLLIHAGHLAQWTHRVGSLELERHHPGLASAAGVLTHQPALVILVDTLPDEDLHAVGDVLLLISWTASA